MAEADRGLTRRGGVDIAAKRSFLPTLAAPRDYCGNACRQAAYRRRVQKRPNDPSRLLALDIAEYRFRSQLRRRLGKPEFRAYLLRELQMTVTETPDRLGWRVRVRLAGLCRRRLGGKLDQHGQQSARGSPRMHDSARIQGTHHLGTQRGAAR